MVEIKNSVDLEKWLSNKPVAFAHAIAARIALRVLPLYAVDRRPSLTLNVWHAGMLSWATGNWPTQNVARASFNAALAIPNDKHVVSNTSEHVARVVTAAAFGTGSPIRAFTASAARAVYPVIRNGTYAAITSDASFLERHNLAYEAAQVLLLQPLWLQKTHLSILAAWSERKIEFTKWGDDWDIWIDWYEQRLKGSPVAFSRLPVPYDEVSAAIAMESEAFWHRPPAEVNAEIKARLDAARPLEVLPGPYTVSIESNQLTARPVPLDVAQQEFGVDLLEALRDQVSRVRAAIDTVQDDPFLPGLLDQLAEALSPSLNDLRVGRLSALSVAVAAQAAAHDDPSRESHAIIRGALNGLRDNLDNLLALSNAVREARASQVALQITTPELPKLEAAIDAFADVVTQSGLADQSVIAMLTEGRSERAQLDELQRPLSASPVRLQAITRKRAELDGQALVNIWNVTAKAIGYVGGRFGNGIGDGAEELGRELTLNAGRASFLVMLHSLGVPLAIIAMLVPSFIKMKEDVKKLETLDKKDDNAPDDDKEA